MKPVINIKNVTLNIHTYQRAPAFVALGAALAAATAQSPSEPVDIAIPDVGQVWPSQGGINGGFVPARGDVPEHYLIIAAKDAGSHEWGGRGIEVSGLSKTDGYTNTQVLVGNEDEREYPAANACAEYKADGHHDFYLPSAAELYHAWVNCPEAFAKEWYWSSTQRSAYLAFLLHFEGGSQGTSGKRIEFLVRPVRRKFI